VPKFIDRPNKPNYSQPMKCPICGKRPLPGFDNCPNPFCHEAKFYQMMAGKKKRREPYYSQLAKQAQAKALRAADSR
jgi:hypothetical protein